MLYLIVSLIALLPTTYSYLSISNLQQQQQRQHYTTNQQYNSKLIHRSLIPKHHYLSKKDDVSITLSPQILPTTNNNNKASTTLEKVETLNITLESIILLSLCFCVTTLCSLDKVAMSVAIIPMSSQFLYDETTKGN